MFQNLPFSMEKRTKTAGFWSKIEFFGFRQAVEGPPSILRVLDAKEQVVGTHRSQTHNLEHPYAPIFAIFMKKRPKMAILWSEIEFFGCRKAVEDTPPYTLSVLGAKNQVDRTHKSQNHNSQPPCVPKFANFQ